MRWTWTTVAALLALAACREDRGASPAVPDAGAAGAASSAPAAPAPAPAGAPASAPTTAAEPPPAMALYRAADASFQQGDHAAALEQAQAAAAADPSRPLAWNLVGRAAAKRFERTRERTFATMALEAYGRALQLDPNFLPAWQNLGELHEALGRPREAAEAWARVLTLSPDHPDRERLRARIEAAGRTAGAPPER